MHSLHHSVDECKIFLAPEKNNETRSLEEEVQKYATFVQTVKTVIESIVPAVLSMFLGVWSDTHGRKPLVVWPLFGEFGIYFFMRSKINENLHSNIRTVSVFIH